LETEIREHAKTKKDLERCSSTLKGFSEFLAKVQISSSEHKAVVMTEIDDQDLSALLSKIDNNQEYLEDCKERMDAEAAGLTVDYEHQEQLHEGSTQSRQPSITELNDQQDQEMGEVKQDSPTKRRYRSDRRSSRSGLIRRG